MGLTAACNSPEPDREPATGETGSIAAQRGTAASAANETGTPVQRVRGQLLYVSAYSHINIRDERRTLNLATTLSVRNTSRSDTLIVDRVDYYNNDGALVRHYLEEPRAVGPLASTSYIVREEDLRGGVGANFLVHWTSRRPIDPPVVESVNLTTQAALGISFTSTARVLSEQ